MGEVFVVLGRCEGVEGCGFAHVWWGEKWRSVRKKAAGIPAGLWGHIGLFVVFASCGDAEGAVEGFEEKHAHQLVGEGQFGEGEPPVASRLDLGC